MLSFSTVPIFNNLNTSFLTFGWSLLTMRHSFRLLRSISYLLFIYYLGIFYFFSADRYVVQAFHSHVALSTRRIKQNCYVFDSLCRSFSGQWKENFPLTTNPLLSAAFENYPGIAADTSLSTDEKYAESIYKPIRFPSRTVYVGNVQIGSRHPIACQTMTTSSTRDVLATVEQIVRCKDYGADYVRLTVQGVKEAEASMKIKEELLKRNIDIPLVADIHFTPKVALLAADAFDKIRVNPGNFMDGRKKFNEKVFDDVDEFLEGKKRIEEVFLPLVEKCKQLKRAMRIGTNQGSLSARITSYYGDSPIGMVESAFEFADICRSVDFHNFCFSMKSSNPTMMVQSYRTLVSEMYKRGWDYPIHVGVTEAGEGEDGRVKSAVGIGTLLQDGIGDTIRVSLTVDPWEEMGPCRRFAALAHQKLDNAVQAEAVPPYNEKTRNFRVLEKREIQLPVQQEGDTWDIRGILHRDGSVLSKVSLEALKDPAALYQHLGCKVAVGMPLKDVATSDSIVLDALPPISDTATHLTLRRLQDAHVGILAPLNVLEKQPLRHSVAVVTLKELYARQKKPDGFKAGGTPLTAVSLPEGTLRYVIQLEGDESDAQLNGLSLLQPRPVFLLLNIHPKLSMLHASRRIFNFLKLKQLNFPVIHCLTFPPSASLTEMSLRGGMEIGSLLVDKLGEGIFLQGNASVGELRALAFNILQGSRMRNTKTEFISCPSCGRTLFDLQEVTNQIRERTGHLPGVSIAVMGCIVNGVGEMADADFGYVGGAPGLVDLYVGKELIQRGIPNKEACDRLIDLIKAHGRWADPPKDDDATNDVPSTLSNKEALLLKEPSTSSLQ